MHNIKPVLIILNGKIKKAAQLQWALATKQGSKNVFIRTIIDEDIDSQYMRVAGLDIKANTK